jgi:hypothetical protein
MIRRNPEREGIIRQYWNAGNSVATISDITGIPRGTVGYYVRKLNKASQGGSGHPLMPTDRNFVSIPISDLKEATRGLETKKDISLQASRKIMATKAFLNQAKNLVKAERYADLYQWLLCHKLFPEAMKGYQFTNDEREISVEFKLALSENPLESVAPSEEMLEIYNQHLTDLLKLISSASTSGHQSFREKLGPPIGYFESDKYLASDKK